MFRRRPPQLRLITGALRDLIPGCVPARVTVHVVENYPDGTTRNSWSGSLSGLADRVHTRLYGQPDPVTAAAPIQQAEDAKRARDTAGEIDVLSTAHEKLTTAPWYPVRLGDVLHVHYEAAAGLPDSGETYVVDRADEDPELKALRLVGHTLTTDESAGMFVPGDVLDPLFEPWFEAGPHRLTLVRDGRIVHDGGAR